MLPSFVSITDLQRQLKSIFASKQPIHVILSRNAVTGLVISKEATELLLASGALDQIREELWELRDRETHDLVTRGKAGELEPVSFDSFAKKHGV